ncbi:MAG: ATP-binding protein [Devosia sp.]
MQAWLQAISPVTYAVALTAIIAATLFIIADYTRTLEDLRHRTNMVSQLAAAQPLLARQFAAGSLDLAIGETNPNEALTSVAQRGTLVYVMALLVAAGAFRRRPPTLSQTGPSQLADLISTIPFGVACWTLDGRMIACNRQFSQRLSDEEPDLAPGAHYKGAVLRLIAGGNMRLLSESEEHRMLELRRGDGRTLMIDERPLGEDGFITLLTDVTDRLHSDDMLATIREEQRVLARRYHEEKLRAEAASRSKTSFLAHLSHDIRTPLNHIIGFADLMRHQTYGPLGDERYETYVESIKSSGDRLLGFFASILDLAELESGEKILQPTTLAVDDLLVSVTRRFSAQAQRAGLSFSVGAPCGALLRGDRFSLERMLGNLVENAVRFTPSGGRIKIAAHVGADGVVLEVTDTGIGMSAERVSALSQPFAFSDATLTRDREGTGLGLAIARKIVELSGGSLVVDSRPGLGTTVAVSLPLLSDAGRIEIAA